MIKALLTLGSVVGFSLLGMIYGWGLTPENWWAIIVSYLGILLLPAIIKEV